MLEAPLKLGEDDLARITDFFCLLDAWDREAHRQSETAKLQAVSNSLQLQYPIRETGAE